MKLEVDDENLGDRLEQILRSAAVVVMPCDTIYGFVGVAPDTEAAIRALKGRQEKSFLRLIPDLQWLPRYTETEMPPQLQKYWPGALTVIFPAKRFGTVALRIPDDPLLLTLMHRLDKPLFSTSVNRSGRPALWRIRDILEAYEQRVAAVVDAGDRTDSAPSTILDITAKPFRLLRRGAVQLPSELLQ